MSSAARILEPTYFRITAMQYRKTAFIGRPPSTTELRQMVEDELLPGEIRGDACWIFVNENGHPIDIPNKANGVAEAAAAKLLNQWQNDEPS